MQRAHLAVAAAVSAAALVLGTGVIGVAQTPPRPVTTAERGPQRGGTITYFQYRASEHYDPQRMYVGRDLANFGRLTYRSLVAFPTSTNVAAAARPVPDLATDTGTHNSDATQWSFTLKSGVRWQDGKPVTCADVKYGVSRTFATDVIIGGPNYIIGYLDIPTSPGTGQSIYTGPYRSSSAGRAAFDKAVTCAGRTITYHFKKPWPDFPLAIASLRAFDPYRKDQDHGDRSNFAVFSDGPYKVQGTTTGRTLTFVRNPRWDPDTDTVRQAYPDRFVFKIGIDPDTQYEQLIRDTAKDAVTTSSVPPADYRRITGSVAKRATLVHSPFVDYLLPNFNSRVMKNPKVRLALAQATNKAGWNSALGGDKASTVPYSIISPLVPGYRKNPAFAHIPAGGAPAKARATLKASGLKLPVPIKFTYPGGTPEAEGAASALKHTWEQAGFKVTLDELPSTYYTVVQNPHSTSDVVYGGWGADWPSAVSVVQPLFDSRINLSRSSNGQDYGNYRSAKVNHMIDAAGRLTNLDKARAAYAKIDAQLGRDLAYIPLDIAQFYYLHGSNVTGYVNAVSTSAYPDLAVISLAHPGS